MDLVRITWIKNLMIRPNSLLIKPQISFWCTLTSSSNLVWLTLGLGCAMVSNLKRLHDQQDFCGFVISIAYKKVL